MRLTARFVSFGIASYLLMSLALVVWTFLWPQPHISGLAPADAIVCMGGGMDRRGTLAAATLTRVDRCVQLYEARLAPVVVFTGGVATPAGPSAGTQMGRYAQSLGLPEGAAIVEGRAQSTLQNALFSLPLTPDAQSYILVTEAFHLPRTWASFRWAVWETNAGPVTLQLVMSEHVRRDDATGAVNWNILFRESLAIWFNAARALAYSAAPHKPVDWLH